MKVNLSNIIKEARTPTKTASVNIDKEFENALIKNFQIIDTLAKIACYQNDIEELDITDLENLEKISSKLKNPFGNYSEQLNKLATVIREHQEFSQKFEIEQKAEKLATQLVDSGFITAEEVIPKLAELRLKSSEDLTVLEKALELNKQSEFLSMGKLSDSKGPGSLSAADQFLNELINN